MKRHDEPHSVRHVTILKCYFCTLTCFDGNLCLPQKLILTSPNGHVSSCVIKETC